MIRRRLIGRRRRAGLSLLEVIISSLLVGVVLVSSMGSLGAAFRAASATKDRGRAILLADGLMAEILQTRYRDPGASPVFGPESGETGATRAAFDDVDDYDDWTETPPQTRSGTVLTAFNGWTRSVVVQNVDSSNLQTVLADSADSGVKRITVTVSRGSVTECRLVALQTTAWLDMIPQPGNNRTTGSMPPVNRIPTIVATGTPLTGTGQINVQFDARSSSDPDGDPLIFAWDFGDGTKGSGSRPAHLFKNTGTTTKVFTVKVTVTDPYGGVASKNLTVTVHRP